MLWRGRLTDAILDVASRLMTSMYATHVHNLCHFVMVMGHHRADGSVILDILQFGKVPARWESTTKSVTAASGSAQSNQAAHTLRKALYVGLGASRAAFHLEPMRKAQEVLGQFALFVPHGQERWAPAGQEIADRGVASAGRCVKRRFAVDIFQKLRVRGDHVET